MPLLFSANKTKVQLKLAVSRIRLVQQKKLALAKQLRREIAHLLEEALDFQSGVRSKNPRSAIVNSPTSPSVSPLAKAISKTELLIRDDYASDALEIVDFHVQNLVSRFDILSQGGNRNIGFPPEEVRDSVIIVIWVTPWLKAECKELAIIKDQLATKFGKDFINQITQSLDNSIQPSNIPDFPPIQLSDITDLDRLATRLRVLRPEQGLVVSYLYDIAAQYDFDISGLNLDKKVSEIVAFNVENDQSDIGPERTNGRNRTGSSRSRSPSNSNNGDTGFSYDSNGRIHEDVVNIDDPSLVILGSQSSRLSITNRENTEPTSPSGPPPYSQDLNYITNSGSNCTTNINNGGLRRNQEISSINLRPGNIRVLPRSANNTSIASSSSSASSTLDSAPSAPKGKIITSVNRTTSTNSTQSSRDSTGNKEYDSLAKRLEALKKG